MKQDVYTASLMTLLGIFLLLSAVFKWNLPPKSKDRRAIKIISGLILLLPAILYCTNGIRYTLSAAIGGIGALLLIMFGSKESKMDQRIASEILIISIICSYVFQEVLDPAITMLGWWGVISLLLLLGAIFNRGVVYNFKGEKDRVWRKIALVTGIVGTALSAAVLVLYIICKS